MDVLTELISSEIKKQYKSVRRFAMSVGIAQTTIVSAIKNGIGGTSFNTVMKICEALNIKMVNYSTPFLVDSERDRLLDVYGKLDDKGKHTVDVVLELEYNRCRTETSEHFLDSCVNANE